jgi:hypothetical protein
MSANLQLSSNGGDDHADRIVQSDEFIARRLVECLWPKNEGAASLGDDFSKLDIVAVHEPFPGVFKLLRKDGSFIFFSNELQSAVVFRNDQKSDNARKIATDLMNQAGWPANIHVVSHPPRVEDGLMFDELQTYFGLARPLQSNLALVQGKGLRSEAKPKTKPAVALARIGSGQSAHSSVVKTGSAFAALPAPHGAATPGRDHLRLPLLLASAAKADGDPAPQDVPNLPALFAGGEKADQLEDMVVSPPEPPKAPNPPVVGTRGGFFKNIWANRNEILFGAAAGSATRVTAQFVGAKVITLPVIAGAVVNVAPIVTTIASAVLLGALAGGVSKAFVAWKFGHAKDFSGYWKAFKQGAKYGAVGGAAGLWFTNSLLSPDGLLHGWFAPFVDKVSQNIQVPGFMQGSVSSDTLSGGLPKPSGGVDYLPDTILPGEHIADTVLPPTYGAEQEAIKKLVSAEDLKQLPGWVRSLLDSNDPKKLLSFCKEVSYDKLNLHHHARNTLEQGAGLLKIGAQIAAKAHLQGTNLADKVFADLGYVNTFGVGTPKDPAAAMQLMGEIKNQHVIHDFPIRLTQFLKAAIPYKVPSVS